MSYRHEFNTLASDVSELTREAQQNLDSQMPGTNPDIVNAMHEALDVPHASTTDEENLEFQNAMRDLAEASGSEGASGGRILSGAAATAVSNNTVRSEEEKKKREDARFLDTLLSMRADLDRRIDDLEQQYEDTMQKAQEHFDKANEADDLANKIEDGTATAEEIERARKIMGKDKNSELDPKTWTADLRKIRDIQNRFGLKEADHAQGIREKADHLREERNDLDRDIDRIQTLRPEERFAAAQVIVEKREAVDLDSEKLRGAPETQDQIDQVAQADELQDSTLQQDETGDEFTDMGMSMPPSP